ncbi:hypothetical protein N7494_011209 [Penicillium frequentans]|uniref:Tryptophan synthase beta chain-like PALP domain-containing protein n=1 Tax=Penicillium frequentans TaxID=3151616 RepID=A0AAD6CJD4_9EURO|nr:hypothetical protein N7494_011209 [Penicillium glabrum]
MIKMTFQLPEKFAQIPRYQLLYSHPSPIHPLKSLAPPPGHHPNHPKISIFAKREDQSSPLACSGNKYRKLEYIVPDILSDVPKYGYHEHHPPGEKIFPSADRQPCSSQKAQSKATTLALVLLHCGTGGGLRTASDKGSFLRTGNVQINRLLGADVQVFEEGDPVADDAHPVLERLRGQGEIPYWIPGGASLHPLGGLGYARAAAEIAEQEQTLQLEGSGRFDVIFVACGSGSTHGGLIAGFKMLDKMGGSTAPRKLMGILNSPTKPRVYHEERVLTFARRAGAFIGLEEDNIGKEDVWLEDGFVGTGYGILDEHTSLALERMAQMEGVILDPVYTAKVASAMMYWVQEKGVTEYAEEHGLKHVNVLFIHTGGQAALGAYADRL